MAGLITQLKNRLVTEWEHLTRINKTDRLWQMPVAAAVAAGLPLWIGAYLGHLEYGLVSSLGGMTFLYLPRTNMAHRMLHVMAAGFGMTSCYTLGLLSHFVPLAQVPMIIFVVTLVTMTVRVYAIAPPGAMFFVMAAAIGAYTPASFDDVPLLVGLLAMGCVLAVLIAFFYSLLILRTYPPRTVSPNPTPTFDAMVFDPVMIALFTGLSMAMAEMLAFEKAYWVPISCMVVVQEASLRAVWNRHIQRIVGTGIGIGLAACIFLLPLSIWLLCLIMMVLVFIIEFMVVRHYGFAAIFFTPLAILLAEAAHLGQGSPWPMMEARFFDTVLGCVIGLLGGICIHHPEFRRRLGAPLRKMIPVRFH